MSSFPLLRLNSNFDSYINGEVSIHPSAVISLGVILQAAANSKIIIGSGVCIGMGSILQVSEGIIEIEAGANLGAGFLMVGPGKIGANACIGAATTIFSCSVAPEQVVPSGSIFGDTSRQIFPEPQMVASTADSPSINTQVKQTEEKGEIPFVASSDLESQATPPDLSAYPPEPSQPEKETYHSLGTQFGAQIYGQGSIHRLLITLFPHRQSLSDSTSDNQSE